MVRFHSPQQRSIKYGVQWQWTCLLFEHIYINSKTYTYTMEEKQMKVLTAKNIRTLITQVNELKIQKENIVSLQFNDGQYLLIYYGV